MRSKALPALLVLLLILTASQVRAEKAAFPSLPDTKITVPWDQFVKMMEELGRKPAPPPPPPFDVSVGRAAYSIRLSSGRLESSVILYATAYGEGWHELFVAGRDTPLVSVWVDDKEAVTFVRDDGVWVAFVGEGKKTIRAVVVCDAPQTPGPHTVTIPGPNAAVRGVDLSYPRYFTDVGVGGVVTASAPGRISSVLSGSGGITVSYTVAAVDKPEAPGKKIIGPPEIIAEVLSVMDIEEEAVLSWTRIGYEVRNAPVRSFRVKLPKGFDLLDVTGEGIASWKVSEDRTEVAVTVGYDVIGTYGLVFSFEKGRTEDMDSAALPKVTPVGAIRTTGFVMVVSGGGFEVTEEKAELLTPRDPSELPQAIVSLSALPPILAYRFTDPGFSLSVAIGKGEALYALSAFADSANSVVLVTTDGKMVVRTNYFIRNRNLQFLKISLPAGSVFWSASVRGIAVRTSTKQEGVVMVPLPMGTGDAAEPFIVSVVIFVPTKTLGLAGRLLLPLPRLEIPTGQMMATFYLPEGMSYLSFGGDMEPIEYFTEVLSSEATKSFVSENMRLKRSVYERQEELEEAIYEQQQMPDKTGAELPPASEGFDLPLRGKVFRFVKLIGMGEETSVSAVYVDRRLTIIVICLLVIAVGGCVIRYRRTLWNILTKPMGDVRKP
ncbi:MAG: hypothetical protein JW765_10235 [Deltaproteobacteria bacterium]|nr:hypothetical protein [Candidatus Zymogenaceae bacterium]